MKRCLGIDLGDARIGLAISDELGMLAHPLETIHLKKTPDPIGHIARIVQRDEIQTIVLGLPRNMDGSYGPAATKSRVFADRLRTTIPCEVLLWDERLTSVAAQRALHESGRNIRESRSVIDQVAAQLILQGYLDSRALSD